MNGEKALMDINGYDITGYTPLTFAAEMGNTAAVHVLVREGKVGLDRGRKTDGATALYLAAQRGHTEIVYFLVEEGADTGKATHTDNSTPIIIATQNNHVECVHLLLTLGRASTNCIRSSDGMTALHLAAVCREDDMLCMILAFGKNLDVNMRNDIDNGATPLYKAAEGGRSQVAKILLESRADPNLATINGNATPLFIACHHGHHEAVRVLLGEFPMRCDIYKATSTGVTPMFAVAEKGDYTMAEILLSAGVNVNQCMKDDGQTPLHVTAARGHLEMVKLLLSTGKANVNQASSSDGHTPLMHAARSGHVAASRALLRGGACVNSCTSIGITPLHASALGGHEDVARLLIHEGYADVNIGTMIDKVVHTL